MEISKIRTCGHDQVFKDEDDEDMPDAMDLYRSSSNRQNIQIILTVTSDFLDLAEKMIKIFTTCKELVKDPAVCLLRDAVYTEEEVCRFLKIDLKTLRSMITEGRLHAYPVSSSAFRIMGRSVLCLFEQSLIHDSWEEAF